MNADLKIFVFGIALCISYVILVIGAFSPIHCRLTITLAGLMSIGIAVFVGSGLTFMLGWKEDLLHPLMPLMMLGIGIDDLFVICNAID